MVGGQALAFTAADRKWQFHIVETITSIRTTEPVEDNVCYGGTLVVTGNSPETP